jgi:hypothetical protein
MIDPDEVSRLPLPAAVAALRRSHDELDRMIDAAFSDPEARAYLRGILNRDRIDELEAGVLKIGPAQGTA